MHQLCRHIQWKLLGWVPIFWIDFTLLSSFDINIHSIFIQYWCCTIGNTHLDSVYMLSVLSRTFWIPDELCINSVDMNHLVLMLYYWKHTSQQCWHAFQYQMNLISTVSTNIAFNALHALIFVLTVSTNKIPYSIHNSIALILCIDHLNMPFNVHTRDKVTMITVSGFLTI